MSTECSGHPRHGAVSLVLSTHFPPEAQRGQLRSQGHWVVPLQLWNQDRLQNFFLCTTEPPTRDSICPRKYFIQWRGLNNTPNNSIRHQAGEWRRRPSPNRKQLTMLAQQHNVFRKSQKGHWRSVPARPKQRDWEGMRKPPAWSKGGGGASQPGIKPLGIDEIKTKEP